MKKVILLLLFIFSVNISIAQDEIDELYHLMIGSFSSEEQAENDTTYFNISLHMYPIWENSGEKWLYVEQALASMQDKPYRQRIYKVEQIDDDKFVSKVYSIDEEAKFIGKWKEPEFFNKYDESILIERKGCAVYLDKIDDNIYEGSTVSDDCVSNLRGASYATSIVEITKKGIESWDRGYNKEGEQVWGAEKGGYVFKRKR